MLLQLKKNELLKSAGLKTPVVYFYKQTQHSLCMEYT